MSLNLDTLALHTGACPATNICVDARPYKPGSNELLSGSDSWMREVMEGTEHSSLPIQWDQWTLCTCGGVTVEWVGVIR